MTEPSSSDLASQHVLGDTTIPQIVERHAESAPLDFEWCNELGGLTFSTPDRFYKWNPTDSGVDLGREAVRLEWLAGRHPAPTVVAFVNGDTEQLLITEALPGRCAVGDAWRARRSEAITVIAHGLAQIHSVPFDDARPEWATDTWFRRTATGAGTPPPLEDPVLVHGDACAPNTLIDERGNWVGHVDLGDMGVGDRWADLAIASLSLDWNFGPGHQDEFFDAYGVVPDPARIRYYRALWHLEA